MRSSTHAEHRAKDDNACMPGHDPSPGPAGAAGVAQALQGFHPAVAGWFAHTFPAATQAQAQAWPAIASGRNVLVAAPTGSGKTLTAFLAGIDGLVRAGLDHGLHDAVAIVYVSPLKALSNDIRINLEEPLQGIRDELARLGLPDVDIRTAVRTGDTPQGERALQRRTPPHILVTTPESLYVLLGSDSGRAMLATTRSVIVDEIHALAGNKRGSHLALSLERLQALCGRPLPRIGLSATQKPIDEVARFLVGTHLVGGAQVAADGTPDCTIVDIGYTRERDLALVLPEAPLSAVMSHEQWAQAHERLATLARAHKTTLVFVNTRRMAERTAMHLSEALGKEKVAAHHGSLAKELRLDAEQRLKRGELQVLVATASLELGIDIGDVDLVCQIGTPRSIAAFLQRVGRSGHHVGGVPKGRLFATSRDELAECVALLDSVRRGELDALRMPPAPLDVLAQHIVAEVAAREWDEAELRACCLRAWPYARMAPDAFDAVVKMLADGYTTRRGHRAGYLHRDGIHGVLRARKGGRMTALMSGGTIPDTADYAVMLEPDAQNIGTVNEDFAIESTAGDIFQLGNASYRILRVEPGRVRVEDAKGAPPSIPFWLGEAPGRTDELSMSVSRLRTELDERLSQGQDIALAWLVGTLGLDEDAARQLLDYFRRQKEALGLLPTREHLAMERFFDESGGTQLVIHSPYGSRINRAWGLALRKRFCRSFNFELQAAATEDAIVLSLSTSHSFPLADVAKFLHSSSARDVLVQALLDAPLFPARWRWNATTALALPRFVGGKKVAPQLQRMKSEDLLATVFPDQVACLENIVGERQVPDHPLVAQTLDDCLHEAMDTDGWLALLRGLESGDIAIAARDLTAPSPFAAEALNARPYAFLDDAPLEERRTQAVMARRYADADSAGDLGQLDAAAIDMVRTQAWPEAANIEDMHDALMGIGYIADAEAAAQPGWPALLQRLAQAGRATHVALPGQDAWIAAERLPQWRALHPHATCTPVLALPDALAREQWEPDAALVELLRARLSGTGPVAAAALAQGTGLSIGDIDMALLKLESQGNAMRGRFTPGAQGEEWCDRGLLARIHRATLGRLRAEIEPVEARDFMRFLFDWQRVTSDARVRGPDALASVIAQLEGYEAPAAAWEADVLPARVADYAIAWLDDLCTAGRVAWARLRHVAGDAQGEATRAPSSLRGTPIVLLPRRNAQAWARFARGGEAPVPEPSARAQRVLALLQARGALFFDQLLDGAGLLQVELEDALAELVATGRVHCDSFAGLRALLVPPSRRASGTRRGQRRASLFGIEDAGRWSLVPAAGESTPSPSATVDAEAIEHIARALLRRYGVVCWRLLEREAAWLPPWRELLRVYRRLEARGELRGGRFISGLTGEQYALPEAVAALRAVRRKPREGQWVALSAHDPLNLAGTLLAGDKVPRQPGARVLYRDGIVAATLVAGEITFAPALDPELHAEARQRLLREPGRVPTPAHVA